jgi:hypothetical protein
VFLGEKKDFNTKDFENFKFNVEINNNNKAAYIIVKTIIIYKDTFLLNITKLNHNSLKENLILFYNDYSY